MKYAIFTFEGYGFPIAQHLINEGHDVIVGQVDDYIKTLPKIEKFHNEFETQQERKLRLSRYQNIIPKISANKLVKKLKKVKNPQEYFVFFDSNNLFYYANQLKKLEFHGNFPTEKDRLFEIDRNFAKNFVKKYYPELKITKKKSFHSVNDGITFLNTSHDIWVLKSQTDALQTFVPNTNDVRIAKKQLIETLRIFHKYYEHAGFFLEVKIPTIQEYIPEKIYYDGIPLFTTVMIENKYIGSGNLSFQVGCAEDIVFPISMKSKMHDLAFPPIVDELAKKHKGLFIWDALLMINPETNDIYFGEFCSNRPGYNSTYTMLAQMPSIHYFFETVSKQKNPFKKKSVGASVTTFNLLRNPKTNLILENIPIDYPKENEKNLWAYDIYKKLDEDFTRTVGYDHHLAPITAAGTNLKEVVNRLYTYVENYKMPNIYYRPKFDYLSTEYPTSILNRITYGIEKKLFSVPFLFHI